MAQLTPVEALKNALGDLPGVLIAVSGGLDSMTLLHAAVQAAKLRDPATPLRVCAAHFEHGIRGEDSLADMAFVRSVCEKMDVTLICESADVPARAAETGENLEQTARKMRYAFLCDTCRALDLSAVLTAHHADDQAETLLLHLIRGSSLSGLCGIREKSVFNGVPVLRPFLSLTREQLASYATQNHILFREDATNADVRLSRNMLRHRVMPLLRQINPKASQAMARAAQTIEQDELFLQSIASELYPGIVRSGTLDLAADPALPPPILNRILARYLREQGEKTVTQEQIAQLKALSAMKTGAKLCIGSNIYENSDGIRIAKPQPKAREYSLRIPKEGAYALPGVGMLRFVLAMRQEDALQWQNKEHPPCSANVQYFDADVLHFSEQPLLCRSWRAGDRLIPFGKNSSKLVSDLFTDQRIAGIARSGMPVVLCGEQILLVAGLRRAAIAPITKETKRILTIRWEPQNT